MGLNKLTIKEASEGLKKGEFTSVDLTQACLTKDGIIEIEHTATRNLEKRRAVDLLPRA